MTELVADRRLHPATVPVKFLKDAPATALGIPAFAGFAGGFRSSASYQAQSSSPRSC